MRRIYFDNAATTPLDTSVLNAMMPYFTEHFGNPSAIYSYGRTTRLAIEMARKTVAQCLQTKPSNIFFTSSGTESINTILNAAVSDLHCKHIITSPIEHHATLNTLKNLTTRGDTKISFVKILSNGHIDLEDLEKLLCSSNSKIFVSLMHANNEIGTMLRLHAVGKLCRKYNAYFHSDTVQTVGHTLFDLKNTLVDFIAASAHKFHGPKGVGMMYVNENVQIKPLIHGGAQERNMRAGTENVAGIVGFATALQLATDNYEHDSKYISSLKLYCKEKLLRISDAIQFNGDTDDKNLYTILSVNFPKNEKTEMLLYQLDIKNICVSAGSACASGTAIGSHVLQHLQLSANLVTIRLSFSKLNTREEIDNVIEVLQTFL